MIFYSSCITSTGLFAPSIIFLVALVSPIIGEVTLLLAITIRSIFICCQVFHQLRFLPVLFVHISEEEVYEIFRNIFHDEEDALAATIQLFGGDPISWDEDYD